MLSTICLTTHGALADPGSCHAHVLGIDLYPKQVYMPLIQLQYCRRMLTAVRTVCRASKSTVAWTLYQQQCAGVCIGRLGSGLR